MNRTPHTPGFTLIEVLVAMSVMAVMAVMAWQGVDGIVRARNATQTRLEQTLRMSTVISQWEQDLGAIQDSNAVPTLLCDGSTVRLTRRAEGGLQVVAWALRPDSAGGGTFAWWRWASPAVVTVEALQENWLRTQQFQGGEPGQLKTLDGLLSWQVYFYQGNAWSNCQSTGNLVVSGGASAPGSGAVGSGAPSASAPDSGGAGGLAGSIGTNPTVKQALPSGVRLLLNFSPGSGQTGSLTRDTLLEP